MMCTAGVSVHRQQHQPEGCKRVRVALVTRLTCSGDELVPVLPQHFWSRRSMHAFWTVSGISTCHESHPASLCVSTSPDLKHITA